MKDLRLLVWLTQLGLSVVAPLVGFLLLAIWLYNSCGWGQWVIWAGAILAFYSALEGFRATVKAMTTLRKEKKEETVISFNEHD